MDGCPSLVSDSHQIHGCAFSVDEITPLQSSSGGGIRLGARLYFLLGIMLKRRNSEGRTSLTLSCLTRRLYVP